MEITKMMSGLDPYRQQAKVEKTDADSARAKNAKGSSGSGDKVSLSAEARQRTEAYKEAMSAPEVRREKVEVLKAQVESGEYQVDSRKIAENMLKDDLDLFL
ncbi:MAG: flagellar biosynthesis anti-sigma factor FlgM [Desulfovibrionaceae bacterium]|jgi:negative regulator of flagellin synthesis FlgM|nr:flagellar biosynthesis anti-sigma factor FlgM [Desulfovibrionaceae bacterium]